MEKVLIICGAGGIGRRVVEEMINYNFDKYKSVVFFDNNKSLTGTCVGGYEVISWEAMLQMCMDEECNIIIATNYWKELYKQIEEAGFANNVIDVIFDRKEDVGILNDSLSQEGEDLFLKEVFYGKRNGFYVDIGAHHPFRFSNTAWAYKKGWHGINIEPNDALISEFNVMRKRDINLACGIGMTNGVMRYYMFNEPALNNFTGEHMDIEENGFIGIMEIPIRRLDEVLDSCLVDKIDFMSIDVEGMELEVLKSNNWEKYKPIYLLVEQCNLGIEDIFSNDVYKYLKEIGYTLLAKTLRTSIYRCS